MLIHWNKPVVNIDGSPLLWIHGEKKNWKKTVDNHISGILYNCSTNFYIGILDGKGNFRKTVATHKVYKGHRKNERPPFYEDIKKYLIDKYKFEVYNGAEADDVLCMLQNTLTVPSAIVPKGNGTFQTITSVKPLSYIASIDKDIPQKNGWHYNLKSHIKFEVTDDTSYILLSANRKKIIGCGYKFLFAQMLMGDNVDNIPGLPKCGPVKTFAVLKDCNTHKECFNAVKSEYQKKYSETWKAEMIETFHLVNMLTTTKNVEPIKIQNLKEITNDSYNYGVLKLF